MLHPITGNLKYRISVRGEAILNAMLLLMEAILNTTFLPVEGYL